MRRATPKLKMTRRDTISAIIMTLKISLKAGKGGAAANLVVALLDAITSPINAVLEGALVTAIVTSIATQDFLPVLWILLSLLGIKLCLSLVNRFTTLKRHSVWQSVYAYTDEIMALKYASLPLSVRESKQGAELFERAQRYQSRIAGIFADTIRIFGNIVGFITAFIALAVVSPLLSVIIVMATVPLAIIEFRQMKKREIDWRKYSIERRKSWQMSSILTDKDRSLEVQVNGITKFFAKEMVRLRRLSELKDIEREKKYLWPSFITQVIEAVISYGAMVFVALEIMFGRLAVGQFVTIRSLINTLSSNSTLVFGGISSIGIDLVNANDFARFMEQPEQADGNEIIPPSHVPKIEFRNVFFRYPGKDKYALDDVSFVITPGEDVAIVGENGAGKTTLTKMLMGIYEPESGEILIDDIPIKDLKRRDYLRHIGTLFQQFNQYGFATLGENVWFGDVRQPYDEERIKRSLSRAGAKEIVESLPKGLKQILSREFDETNGANLSGGQWQKVALARSFFRNPNILVLDEPTSAIDAKAEYEIFREIMESQKTKTTIIISHRFSTVRKAENILVMEEGKIIERGTHAELMAHKGLYSEMFDLQAEGYK